jgi:two-component system response regulator FixJ
MAAELGVSQRTVEIHRAHVMRKMGASSLAQLVRMTIIAGA